MSTLTNKAILLGMANFAAGIPTLALTMYGGSVADRFDKRKILIATQIAQILLAVGLGWLVYREPFGLRETVAMLVIFAGVGLVKWQSGKAALAKMEVEA